MTTIKVVTDRGSVYMMGLLTEGEAKRAVEVARVVGGVKKVVNVFQIITPAQLAALQAANDAQPPAPAASAPAATPAPVKP